MRQLIFIAIILILFGCPHTNNDAINAEKAGLVPGSENPIIKECPKGKAYIYKEFEIHVEPSPEAQGMDIFLYAPEISGGNPCGLDRKTASNIISTGETEGNNFFGGIYQNYLFIDQGTGSERRILSVYNLTTKSLILYTEYSDPNLKDGILTYYKTLVPDPGLIDNIPCPDAKEWNEKGLIVLYEQKENFDLKTESRTPIRAYRCSAVQ